MFCQHTPDAVPLIDPKKRIIGAFINYVLYKGDCPLIMYYIKVIVY